MHYIYLLINRINHKVYVGVTNNYEKRMREHSYAYGSTKINRAVKKYGWSNFDHQILLKTTYRNMEIFYIKLFNSMQDECGYNLCEGGQGVVGYKASPETKEKQRQAKIGTPLNKEHRDKISASNTGKIHSPETRQKIAAKLTGNKNFEGHTFTEETKAILSQKKSKHHKFINPQGELTDIFNLRKFCLENNLSPSAMCRVSKGQSTHHKGWKSTIRFPV